MSGSIPDGAIEVGLEDREPRDPRSSEPIGSPIEPDIPAATGSDVPVEGDGPAVDPDLGPDEEAAHE